MHFIRIDRSSHPLFARCREIYCNNFPLEEQRDEREQERVLVSYPNYHLLAIMEGDSIVGILAYWRFINCYFGEHLAIDGSFKGEGFGSRAVEYLKGLADKERIPLLLEIEIPNTPQAVRRAGFYMRLGLDINTFTHFQPPFHKEDKPMEMKLMSYPYLLGASEYAIFREQYSSIMPDFSKQTAESETDDTADNFMELGLGENLLKAVRELGYERPTPVQQRIIPEIIEKEEDVVCLAQTGTGKTAAFSLPLLHKIEKRMIADREDTAAEQHKTKEDKKWYSFFEKKPQVLILSPTRELCRQIAQDIKEYSRYMEGFSVVAVYGGAGIEPQIRALRKNPQIIVATPGRMLDLINKKAADISQIHTLVLDEADEMLNMGFKEELDGILETSPAEKNVLLFSATMPMEVERIAKSYMRDAKIITVGERNSGSDNVKHYYYVIHEKERYAVLKRIVDYYPDIYGIIFCRTKKETQDIADQLSRDGYNADSLHGDLSQSQRDYVMSRFKQKTLQMLVATDVAARGIDVNNLTHVINYNLPDEVEQYTHRSGRTGRADKSGKSIVIINSKEIHKIRRIEKIIGKEFSRSKIPSGSEVCSKQLLSLIDRIDQIQVGEEISSYIDMVEKKWCLLSREDIIRKFIACEFNRFIQYYKDAPDLNFSDRKDKGERGGKSERRDKSERWEKDEKSGKEGRKESSKRKGRGDEAPVREAERGYEWVKLNIGEKNKITSRHLLRLMTAIGVGKRGVGKIEIRHNSCYIAIAEKASKYVAEQLNNTEYRGVKLKSSIVK